MRLIGVDQVSTAYVNSEFMKKMKNWENRIIFSIKPRYNSKVDTRLYQKPALFLKTGSQISH